MVWVLGLEKYHASCANIPQSPSWRYAPQMTAGPGQLRGALNKPTRRTRGKHSACSLRIPPFLEERFGSSLITTSQI